MSHYGCLKLILFPSWNVWEFLISWSKKKEEEEEHSVLGPVWLFINLLLLSSAFFSFFNSLLDGVVMFLPFAHTGGEEAASQRVRTKLSFSYTWVLKTGSCLVESPRTHGLHTDVDVFPVKARGVLWNLFVMIHDSFFYFLLHKWENQSYHLFSNRRSE